MGLRKQQNPVVPRLRGGCGGDADQARAEQLCRGRRRCRQEPGAASVPGSGKCPQGAAGALSHSSPTPSFSNMCIKATNQPDGSLMYLALTNVPKELQCPVLLHHPTILSPNCTPRYISSLMAHSRTNLWEFLKVSQWSCRIPLWSVLPCSAHQCIPMAWQAASALKQCRRSIEQQQVLCGLNPCSPLHPASSSPEGHAAACLYPGKSGRWEVLCATSVLSVGAVMHGLGAALFSSACRLH